MTAQTADHTPMTDTNWHAPLWELIKSYGRAHAEEAHIWGEYQAAVARWQMLHPGRDMDPTPPLIAQRHALYHAAQKDAGAILIRIGQALGQLPRDSDSRS